MAELLRIAICEDTKSERDRLLTLLHKSKIKNKCTVFTSGEQLVAAFKPQIFDLLLIDIYMGGITGLEAIKKVRDTDEDIPVAFVTSSTEHTLESYRLSALKYIEKPFSQKDIEEILHLAQIKKNDVPSLLIQKNGRMDKIPFSQILYMEQRAHQLFIYRKDMEPVSIYEKLSSLFTQLPTPGFFCPHKSFAVNLAFVQFIDVDLKCFYMENGENVPIRRESIGKAKKAFEQYLFDKTRGLVK
ncbi:LytR/AlgR family response regulator transcription factor [Anaerotignum sp.]|uniref:LytR/AlgR family response regulator transcription factor n=1 Tax=Anaerotignum sp. TaxID=2039241 RepID=UPI0028AEEB08|nr:LytTR family DNA-binding domain-containing protein [Anaerotignum sp.]